MAKARCDGCRRKIRIAGGIADFWSSGGPGEGLTIEFADGTEHLLCFDCVEDLPEDPTAEDVTVLSDD